jgi:hypothetical protein
MDTGMLRHRLGLGLQKIRSSSTKMTKKKYTESKPESAQYPTLIKGRDDMPQHDNTVLRSGSRPSARPVQALLSGSGTCTLQQSRGGYSHERSPAALSKVENAGGLLFVPFSVFYRHGAPYLTALAFRNSLQDPSLPTAVHNLSSPTST